MIKQEDKDRLIATYGEDSYNAVVGAISSVERDTMLQRTPPPRSKWRRYLAAVAPFVVLIVVMLVVVVAFRLPS